MYGYLLILLISSVHGWNLTHLGILKYSLLDLSVYQSQGYISIKILEYNGNGTSPTLIEVPWPQNSIQTFKSRIFPSEKFFPDNCNYLRDVISTDIDEYGRMWILDGGRSGCSKKLIGYDLISRRIVYNFQFQESVEMTTVLVDSTQNRSFVGVSNQNSIYVCNFSFKCELYRLSGMDYQFPAEQLTVSKKDTLYVGSESIPSLYAIDLKNINRQNRTIDVQYIGEKLGRSTGLLVADMANILCYCLSRDYAIVCWHIGKPLIAESHSVLIQSYRLLSNVRELILDNDDMWIVNEDSEPACIKIGRFDYNI